jgi:hypothetical protein
MADSPTLLAWSVSAHLVLEKFRLDLHGVLHVLGLKQFIAEIKTSR